MPNYQTLKLELAKLLPGYIRFRPDGSLFVWSDHVQYSDEKIRETEWLYICWLIEQTFDYKEKHNYIKNLYLQPEFGSVVGYAYSIDYDELLIYVHASWQQRALAILKVKGIEI